MFSPAGTAPSKLPGQTSPPRAPSLSPLSLQVAQVPVSQARVSPRVRTSVSGAPSSCRDLCWLPPDGAEPELSLPEGYGQAPWGQAGWRWVPCAPVSTRLDTGCPWDYTAGPPSQTVLEAEPGLPWAKGLCVQAEGQVWFHCSCGSSSDVIVTKTCFKESPCEDLCHPGPRSKGAAEAMSGGPFSQGFQGTTPPVGARFQSYPSRAGTSVHPSESMDPRSQGFPPRPEAQEW